MPVLVQSPPIVARPLQGDADFWSMRALLIDTVPLTPVGLNWDMRRLDGQRFYNADPEINPLLDRPLQLWETADGQLVGYVLSESSGDAHLQVHPDFRYLEEEMVAWAEGALPAPAENGQLQLLFFVNEYDALRQQILAQRGFAKMPYGTMIRHLRLGHQALARPQVADGYTLRTTRTEDLADCAQIAALLNAAFNRDIHNAAEYQNFARRAPSFRSDLDLVMVAPDGAFAAYVGIPYDEINRRGTFEPVCTHPDHRRNGLAKALMTEGLLRLKATGAVDVIVETGDMPPANALYNSMGFTEAYRGYGWQKLFS